MDELTDARASAAAESCRDDDHVSPFRVPGDGFSNALGVLADTLPTVVHIGTSTVVSVDADVDPLVRGQRNSAIRRSER